MIGFNVDSISFYANKVEGHVGRFDTTIYIFGLSPEKYAVIADKYVKRWHPGGYGTSTKVITPEKSEPFLKLERRNSCD